MSLVIAGRRAAAMAVGRCFSSLLADGLLADGNKSGIDIDTSSLANANKFRVDTLAMARLLESQGIPLQHAEAIVSVINDSSFVTKTEMEKIQLIYDFNIFKFKAEIQNFQENQFHSLKTEFHSVKTETNKLKIEVEKLGSELKTELRRVEESFGSKLDRNIEATKESFESKLESFGSKFDRNIEATKESFESKLESFGSKFDRDIDVLKAQMESIKVDMIKYLVGTVVSLSAFGVIVLRYLSD